MDREYQWSLQGVRHRERRDEQTHSTQLLAILYVG